MAARRLTPYTVGETLRLRPPPGGGELLVVTPSGDALRTWVDATFDVEFDEEGDWRYSWDNGRAERIAVVGGAAEPESAPDEAPAHSPQPGRIHGIVEAG